MEQEAFDALKRAVMTTLVLTFPSDMALFHLECDASNFTMGAVLSQLQTDGKFHPVAFMSKSFLDVEWNYEIYDKEMLTIIRALEEWCHFLEGTPERFTILTDHWNLAHFHSAQRLNQRQVWWCLYLSRFDFSLVHWPGKLMGKPDALSRQADHP
jgi:hypothetical protein